MSTFTSLSLRERIIREVVRRFTTQRKDLPVGTDSTTGLANAYDFGWDEVNRQPITESERRKPFVLAVLDPAEIKEFGIHFFRARLQLELRFSILANTTISRESDPSETLNIVLQNIERRIMEDIQLGEGGSALATDKLADQVILLGSELDVDSFQDTRLGGTVFVEVLYKHKHGEPRARV